MFANRTAWNVAPNRLSQALALHRAAGKPLLDLTVSNPTECGFEYRHEAILNALQNPAALHYQPNPKGLETARLAITQYYSALGARVSADDIFLTSSTSEAYSFVFRLLCNPNEELLIPLPSYPLFSFLADILDIRLARYPLVYDHGWQIDFYTLQNAITPQTRAIVIVNPNNPTGHFLKEDERQNLNEICARRNLALIADEVFFDFAFDDIPRHTLAVNTEVPTLVTSGLSKIAGLPQMKIAWLVVNGPSEWKTRAVEKLEVIADTFLSPSTPAQLATPAFLDQARHFQTQVIDRVCRNLSELDLHLLNQKNCSRLRVEGGWYAVLRVPATILDEDLALALLSKTGVYVHPGHFFDFPSRGYLVLSLLTREQGFSEAVLRMLQFFDDWTIP